IECQLKGPETNRLDMLDINLILAAGFVNTDRAAHRDMKAIFRTELHETKLAFKANAFDLRAIVFKCAVDVAGLRGMAVRDFAFHQDIGEIAREEVADRTGQLADGEDSALWTKIELKLAHDSKSVDSLSDRNLARLAEDHDQAAAAVNGFIVAS